MSDDLLAQQQQIVLAAKNGLIALVFRVSAWLT